MLIEIFRLVILGMSAYGFFSFLMFIERKYGKKKALIVSLILGVLALSGLILKV